MKKNKIIINEELCNGCGVCIPNCHEGALQIVDGKARMVNESLCDGLGACIGHCPQGAITIESYEEEPPKACGCPGSQTRTFAPSSMVSASSAHEYPSSLTHWPVQMHLINPRAGHFQGSHLLLAADCVAYSLGSFHTKYLQGKTLAIACPKLDTNREVYVDKLKVLIEESQIDMLTIMIMEVPCCSGLLQITSAAMAQCSRKIPVKVVTVSVDGKIKDEKWQTLG